MANYQVRQANLDDTRAVCDLARAQVGVWQRIDATGHVQDVAYDALTVYERWLHGGPWMTVETGTLQMSHLLLGGGLPVVVTVDERVIAYVEVYFGTEPPPFGQHMHLSGWMVYPEHSRGKADNALFEWLGQLGQQQGYRQVTVNAATNDHDTTQFYEDHGFGKLDTVRRMTIAPRSGQVFYKATEHVRHHAGQIAGWHFNLGRLGSARSQWELIWHPTWDAVPEIKARPTHRLYFNAAGNEALVLVRQNLYMHRKADVFCWTPKPPSGQLITAILDWGQREGYRQLVIPALSESVKTLGLDAQPDGYEETIYARTL